MLKKQPGEGTGPTIAADLRGNLVGRVPPRRTRPESMSPKGRRGRIEAGNVARWPVFLIEQVGELSKLESELKTTG